MVDVKPVVRILRRPNRVSLSSNRGFSIGKYYTRENLLIYLMTSPLPKISRKFDTNTVRDLVRKYLCKENLVLINVLKKKIEPSLTLHCREVSL